MTEQVNALVDAIKSVGASAGNGKLQKLLGLDTETYKAVKAEAISQGLVKSCKGRGGSLKLLDVVVLEVPVVVVPEVVEAVKDDEPVV